VVLIFLFFFSFADCFGIKFHIILLWVASEP